MATCSASKNIKIFPFGGDRTESGQSRFLDEVNLRNIIRCVTDKSSFVLSYDPSTGKTEFVIDGYYISVENMWTILSGVEDIFAYIEYDDNSYIKGTDDGEDDNATFQGVKFVSSEFEIPEAARHLRVLTTGVSETGTPMYIIPESSKLKFTASSVEVSKIVGGDANSFQK